MILHYKGKQMFPEYLKLMFEKHSQICMQMDGIGKKTIMSEVTQTQKDEHGMNSLISRY